jgi:DNA-binding response OmpR family regulator
MKKIVVAENINTILRKKNTFFDRADMRIFTATTTDEVLQIHRAVRLDLIIIPLDMPGMSSKQLCALLKEDKENCPVIIMVCARTQRALERSAQCGIDSLHFRPIKPSQLLDQAKAFLNLSWRETYRVLLHVAVEGSNDAGNFVCNSLNISLDGMLIETDQKLNIGDRLSCSFFLPHGSQIKTTGEIARIVTPAPGVKSNWYGVHFLDVSPETEKDLETFIDANASKSPPRPANDKTGDR